MVLAKEAAEKLGQLGLEPLSSEFTLPAFKKLLQSHSSQIKPFLLNQKHVAGIGNIYVDEALWQAKIYPQRLTDSLTEHEIRQLHQAIQETLKKGIENEGTSLGNGLGNYYSTSGRRGGHQHHLNVFRREGQACPRCKHTIKKIVVAQRGTHICPKCQKRPLDATRMPH